MSRRWQGSTPAWKRVRAFVLTRDHYVCQLQIPGVCTRRATQVHHTGPREITGDNPHYLLAACQPCNNQIGDPTKQDPAPRPTRW